MRPNNTVLIIGVLAALTSPVFAQVATPNEQSDKERAELTLKIATEKAAAFDFYLGSDRTKKLTLHPRSVLRWSNPVSTALYGEVFLWTADGRPEIIASIHKFFQPDRRHMTGEFHSLSLGLIVGRQGAREVWTPQEAGVTFAMLPGAPTVARAAPQRLSQMRSLAREFSAESSARNEPEVRERLRLLPKPMYRYQVSKAAMLDGAIFAFAQGTNPEVLLLLEAREVGDKHAWQYALVRFNSVAMRAFRNERQVWNVPQIAPPWQDIRDPRKAYFVQVLDEGS
jgi:hypothetical protein